jgi:hypothetical protein
MTSEHPDHREHLDAILADIARETGATVSAYPRPGQATERILLRNTRDQRGTQFELAQFEDDGTLRIVGHDTGPQVSEAFGADITSYEWQYVLTPDRVGRLLAALGGHEGDDVLAALRSYYDEHDGRIHALLTSPDVAASLSTWPS